MYRSPFTSKPTQTTPFKKKGNWRAGYHTGEDWVCDNRQLVSPCNGKVSYVGYDDNGYGNYIIIHTDDKRSILMAHFASAPSVKMGQTVKAGDKVGTMGTTGNSTGVHLHIEVQNSPEWSYGENLLKPSAYIDFNDFGGENMAIFKKGDKNIGVLAVNCLLRELFRYKVVKTVAPVSASYTAKTEAAVKEWQKYAGIKVTGIADEATVTAMDKVLLDEFVEMRTAKQEAEKKSAAMSKELATAKEALQDETDQRKQWQYNYNQVMHDEARLKKELKALQDQLEQMVKSQHGGDVL